MGFTESLAWRQTPQRGLAYQGQRVDDRARRGSHRSNSIATQLRWGRHGGWHLPVHVTNVRSVSFSVFQGMNSKPRTGLGRPPLCPHPQNSPCPSVDARRADSSGWEAGRQAGGAAGRAGEWGGSRRWKLRVSTGAATRLLLRPRDSPQTDQYHAAYTTTTITATRHHHYYNYNHYRVINL